MQVQTERTKTPRQSNLLRTQWRIKCRRVLSDHLKDRLGIIVPPEEVRLIPKEEDLYTWAPIPRDDDLSAETSIQETTHLFTKQISKLTLGRYMELCREVGKSFEAIPKLAMNGGDGVGNQDQAGRISFIPRLNALTSENTRLSEEIDKMREETQAYRVAKRIAEEQILLQKQVTDEAQAEVARQKQQNHKLEGKIKHLHLKNRNFRLTLSLFDSLRSSLEDHHGDLSTPFVD